MGASGNKESLVCLTAAIMAGDASTTRSGFRSGAERGAIDLRKSGLPAVAPPDRTDSDYVGIHVAVVNRKEKAAVEAALPSILYAVCLGRGEVALRAPLPAT